MKDEIKILKEEARKMKGKMYVVLFVSIEKKLYEELKLLAELEDKTIQDLFREALYGYIKYAKKLGKKLDVALKEIKEGKVKTFDNVKDLIKELHKKDKKVVKKK